MQRNHKLINCIIEEVNKHSEEWMALDDLGEKVKPNPNALMTLALGTVRQDIFMAHVTLCIETGWLETQSNPYGSEKASVVRLTWAGHDAVDAGESRWQ